MKTTIEILNAITDKVLAYKPKRKKNKSKRSKPKKKHTTMKLLVFLTLLMPVAKGQSSTTPKGNASDSGKTEKSTPSKQSVKLSDNIGREPTIPYCCQQEENRKPISKGWLEIANAYSTIVVAIFACITAIAIFLQVKTSRDTERSWLVVSKADGPKDGHWYVPENPAYFPGALFQFMVSGKTPIRLTKMGLRMHPVPVKEGSKPPKPRLPLFPNYKTDPSFIAARNTGILSPNEGFDISLLIEGPHTLTETEWNSLRDGKTVMCVYGIVKYRDAFKRRKAIKFCYIWHFAWGGVIASPDGTVLNPPAFRASGGRRYNRLT